MNKLAIMLVMAYYMDDKEAVREAQLASDEVESLFFSSFKS